MTTPLDGRAVLVAVDASPDAFAAADTVRALVRAGATVQVAVAADTARYLPDLTLATVSGTKVVSGAEAGGKAAARADAVVAFAAGEAFLASVLVGRPADAATAAFLAAAGPRLVVVSSRLADAPWVRVQLEGLAELAEVLPAGAASEEVASATARACGPRDLAGRRLVITAGPSREAIDPVRFVSNPSTGRMGYALAEAARRRGAEVVLLTGPTSLTPPAGVRVRHFVSADELLALAEEEIEAADVFIAAAAVGDYTPESPSAEKIKKGEGPLVLRMRRTPDVLGTLGLRFADAPRRPVFVGFAAETESVVANAREKLEKKRLDLVVANDVTRAGSGFGSETNEVVLVDAAGETPLPPASKREVAGAILDRVVALF